MGDVNHFYVTLPSTASTNVYKKNNQSNYIVQFPKPLELQGQWEVALSEIHYPLSWSNITSKMNYFTFHGETKTVPDDESDTLQVKFSKDFITNYNIQYALSLMREIKLTFKSGERVSRYDYFMKIQAGINVVLQAQQSLPISILSAFRDGIYVSKREIKNINNQVVDYFPVINLKHIYSKYYLYYKYDVESRYFEDVAKLLNKREKDLLKFVELPEILPYSDYELSGEEFKSFQMLDHSVYLVPTSLHSDKEQFDKYFTHERTIEFFDSKPFEKICYLSPGTYSSCENLVVALNQALPQMGEFVEKIKFELLENDTICVRSSDTSKYYVSFPNSDEFGNTLGEMLGLTSLELDTKFPRDDDSGLFGGYSNFTYSIDLDKGMYYVYVYTDIITQQIVGDKFVNLLRAVPVDNKKHKCERFGRDAYYIPIRAKVINTVQIVILSDSGEEVMFNQGKTLCQLHFRQVSK
jgi:hypothetical protein